eukprot:440864_1
MASSNNHILRPSRNNPIMRVNGVDIDTRIYTTGIERSKYVKNVLRLSGELELRLKPLCKLDYSYQKSKNKKYIGFNIPKHCIYTQFQMYQVFAKLFNPDRSKRPSVNKACLDVFGAIDSDPSQGKYQSTVNRWITQKNVRKIVDIPRNGRPPTFGIAMDSVIAGWINARNHLKQSLSVKELRYAIHKLRDVMDNDNNNENKESEQNENDTENDDIDLFETGFDTSEDVLEEKTENAVWLTNQVLKKRPKVYKSYIPRLMGRYPNGKIKKASKKSNPDQETIDAEGDTEIEQYISNVHDWHRFGGWATDIKFINWLKKK